MFWIPLQYLLGLRELGHDAWWLEILWTRGDASTDRASIDALFRQADALGVADRGAATAGATGHRGASSITGSTRPRSPPAAATACC